MELFEQAARGARREAAPLADRMRPRTLDEFVGQTHLVGPGRLLRLAIDQGELQLYTHPALLLPSARRESWDARSVAQAFAEDLQHRQVKCGVMGMEALPVELSSGHWKRNEQAAQGETA